MQQTLNFTRKRRASVHDTIKCPICSLNLSNFDLYQREYHVDQCASGTTHSTSTSASLLTTTTVVRQSQEVIYIDDCSDVEENFPQVPVNVRSVVPTESIPPTKKLKRKTITRTGTTIVKPTEPKKAKPLAPSFKTITFPLISEKKKQFHLAVDAFNYDHDKDVSLHFLSHFHSDHYIGMTKKWFIDNPGATVYTSSISRCLIMEKFKLGDEMGSAVVAVGGDKDTVLWQSEDKKERVTVITHDANHCPGGLIFIFRHYALDEVGEEKSKKIVLHTGDFRVSKKMISGLAKLGKIDEIYLDTTYLNPIYLFIEQNSLVKKTGIYFSRKFGNTDQEGQMGKNSILNYFGNEKNRAWVLLIGTYSIGKENLFLRLAEYLNTRILIPLEKFKMLRNYIPYQELQAKFIIFDTNSRKFKNTNMYKIDDFTIWDLKHIQNSDDFNCLIHLLPIGKLNDKLFLHKYYNNRKIIKLKPTGWSFRKFSTISTIPKSVNLHSHDGKMDFLNRMLAQDNKFENFDQIMNGMLKFNNDVQLPYSEHSNFKELSLFCGYLKWGKIIHTVNNSDSGTGGWSGGDKEYKGWFRAWKDLNVDWACIEDYFADEPND